MNEDYQGKIQKQIEKALEQLESEYKIIFTKLSESKQKKILEETLIGNVFCDYCRKSFVKSYILFDRYCIQQRFDACFPEENKKMIL